VCVCVCVWSRTINIVNEVLASTCVAHRKVDGGLDLLALSIRVRGLGLVV
jgi:hypothetical protein